jgi:Family of unknown function (DUF5957)
MKTAAAGAIGFVAGFLTGLVLSEIIGVTGFLLTGQAVGVKYLPVYLAVTFAVVAAAARAWIARKPR